MFLANNIKLLLLLFISLMINMYSLATHVAGGYISYECTGNPNEYLVRLTLYRDCGGAPLADQIHDRPPLVGITALTWTNSCGLDRPQESPNCGGAFGSPCFTMDKVSVREVSQICNEEIPNTTCNGGSLIGYEEHIYEQVVTLPPCSEWQLTYKHCCRNPSTNAEGQDNFAISSTINTSLSSCNTTPQITSAPQPYVCINQEVTYNLGAIEPDGDNIVYSFDHARSSLTDFVNYEGGASAQQPLPGITIDQQNGTVNFTPTQQGNYIIVIVMEEYNSDGVLVSRTEYDFQTYVIECTNIPPDVDPNGISNIQGDITVESNNEINICTNENACFELVFTDEDPQDVITVTSNFEELFPNSTITYSGTNPLTARLCFDSGSEATTSDITFLIQDDACPVIGQNNHVLTVNTIECGENECEISLDTELTSCIVSPSPFYDVEGTVTFNNPPSTGQLIVQNCIGLQIEFNPPFNSPTTFSVDDLPQTGETCDFTAYFTDDQSCSATSSIITPSPITSFDVDCNISEEKIEGTISFENPPSNGNLIITASDGTISIEESYTMPASSPLNWEISGLDPAASPYIIEYYFENYPECVQQTTINCGCSANAGTTAASINGDSQTNYTLCFDDEIVISSNNDSEHPEDIGDYNGFPYAPEIAYAVYSCPPTLGMFPDDDPCFVTIIDHTNNITDINNSSSILNQLGGEAALGTNTLYFAPITLYHYSPGGPFIVHNECWHLGTVTQVTYSIEITTSTNDESLSCGDPDAVLTVSASGGTPPFTYDWGNGAISTPDHTVSPNSTTTYTVVVTDANGCSKEDFSTVNVSSDSQVIAGEDIETCEGSEVTLSASGASTYQWDNDVQQGEPFIPEVGTNTYEVTGIDDDGCESKDQVTITVHPNPNINAGPEQQICIGETITLEATVIESEIEEVSWDNNVTDGVPFQPTETTTYTVTVITQEQCISSDQVTITVDEYPTVNAGEDMVICYGDSVTLNATGAHTYDWSDDIENNTPFTPSETQTYTVTGYSVNGCPNTDQIEVTVNPIPGIIIDGENLGSCDSISPVLFNSIENENSECQWSLSNGISYSGCQFENQTIKTRGCFDVTLNVTLDNGCSNSQTIEDYICVYPDPIADFNHDPANLTSFETGATFTNGTIGGSEYHWDFGTGEDFSNEENPYFSFPNEVDNYIVTLTATNEYGCKDQISKRINILESLIFYVPNAFTPDDDPFNQTFLPVFTEGFDPASYNLSIFNRWGEVIFETIDTNTGWEGTFRGKNAKEGTYIWRITFNKKDSNERLEYTGHVTLIR